ncbi:unnamed protein product [Heterobilharzia americana]|nr:unnamed protein product [Heterobilharzia americana]
MLGSQVCIQPESSKVFIPPTITVTSTTDSELEFSRSPSSISLVSSDCTNTSHLNAFDDGDDNDDGAGAQSSSKKISVSSCELTSNVNDYQSSLSSSIIPTVRCNSTYPSSMHSPMASGISLYSSSSINNADDNLHKLSLDEIYNSSDIFSSTFNDQTQPPVGFSNQHVNASSLFSHANPECSTSLRPVRSLNGFFQSGASNTCVYSSTTSKHDHSLPHGRQYPENRVGFICLCHGYDGKNQDITLSPKVDSNVTLFDKTLASLPSLSSSSSMVSSSPSSPNNTTSQHQQNGGNPSVKQSRTLLRRFRSFIIQSVRKSGRSVNVNENDKVLCTKGDSVVVKYKVTDRNKKRSKSLRAISNCILSTASVSPSTSPNGVHHRNEMKEKDKSSRSSRRHRLRLHSDHGEQSDWPTCFNDNGHTDDNFLTNSCRQLGIVSKAVEKFISILNEVLDYLSYNNNGSNVNHNNNNNNNNNSGATTSRTIHQLQELCKQTLVELVIVLQCRQFIGDFVKYEGHCKLFQLVETIDKLDKTFHDQIWLHLLSCLVELSKYAITNRFSGDDDDGGAEGGGDNRKTIFPGSCCAASVDYTQYSSEEIIATQKTSQNVSKVNCSSTILTRSIGSHGSAVGREEFFSWQLVSDHFLSVIIDHCRRENNFDCLRHEMKLILKIIIDYPVRIQYVIEQTKHGFILDLLKMINISTAQYKSSVSIALQVDEIRCEMQNLIMKLLYVLLYYGKQNKCLTLLVPQYLENIRFIEWIPELSNRSLWESIIAIYHSPPPPPHYHHHQRRQQQQQYQYEQLEITLVLKRMKEFSSILEENDRMCEAEEKGEGNMHNSVINNDESIGQQGSISRQLSNGNNMKQLSSVQLLGSLCRVQQIVNSLLVTELNTPLDRKSEINIEKMNQLCSVVYFEEYTMNPTTESMEEAFTKLGFKVLHEDSLPRCGKPGSVNRPHNSVRAQVPLDHNPPPSSSPSSLPSRLSVKNPTASLISSSSVAFDNDLSPEKTVSLVSLNHVSNYI